MTTTLIQPDLKISPEDAAALQKAAAKYWPGPETTLSAAVTSLAKLAATQILTGKLRRE